LVTLERVTVFKCRILVADDDEAVLRATPALFAKEGRVVLTARLAVSYSLVK
jgi:CheY-like chemotaxis protein